MKNCCAAGIAPYWNLWTYAESFCPLYFSLLPCRRILAALVAGIATGILGVTGYMGFLIFFASQLLVSNRDRQADIVASSAAGVTPSPLCSLQNAALLYLKCSGKPGRYFTSS